MEETLFNQPVTEQVLTVQALTEQALSTQILMAQALTIAAASIFGILGIVHLIYTFFTNKFESTESSTTQAMKASTIVLTNNTTVWKAWIGFNASHSLGMLLIAALYIPLAACELSLLVENSYLLVIASLFSLAYLGLAIKYWFAIPIIGISIATLCFIAALVLQQF